MVAAGWRRGVPLRAELLTGDVDLVHSVDLDPPPCRAPLVMTIHDVAAIDFPQLHPPRATAAAQRRLRSLDRAAAIVAVSHATATAMTRHGIDVERITVVHGAAHALPSAPAVESGIDGPYLLAVGELTLRKDYPTLFRAFARADLPGYRLVVVGPRGFGAEQVEAAAADSELGDRLCLVGMVSDRRLSAIYAGASALCLTSYEEGFGLPLVEAMQRGLPIIASDIDVVHEIAGGAAATAPAGNVAEFAAAMEAVVRDGAVRERLRAAAVEQSAKFGWDATTDGIVEVYRRVLQR
jgi:glycosyltransferase involved in cell wall biosynthesis